MMKIDEIRGAIASTNQRTATVLWHSAEILIGKTRIMIIEFDDFVRTLLPS